MVRTRTGKLNVRSLIRVVGRLDLAVRLGVWEEESRCDWILSLGWKPGKEAENTLFWEKNLNHSLLLHMKFPA